MSGEFNFDNKFALLDTNTLKAFLDTSKNAERFKPVIDFLRDHDVHPFVISKVTSFEFVGYSTNKKAYDELNGWLEKQFDTSYVDPKDYDLATKISSMYKCKNPSINPKQISFIDCMYAAQLVRFKGNAFVVTTDLNDYPSFLFDMPKHFAIEESTGTTTFVGFKTFNEKKFKKLESDFNKSGYYENKN